MATTGTDLTHRRRRARTALAAAAAVAAVLAGCGQTANQATGGPGMAGLAKTWHNTAPAAVHGSNWSWPIVLEMAFSEQGRWDFTLSDGTRCHADYQLTSVSATKADLSTTYFKCPPFIDGYLGSPSPYPMELRDGQLVTSGAGVATFAAGPATVPPSSTGTVAQTSSTTAPRGTTAPATATNPTGTWTCTIASDIRGSTIDITMGADTWSATYTARHSTRPTEVEHGSGHWQASQTQGSFTGTIENAGPTSIELPLDWQVELQDASELLPFIAVAVYKAGGPQGAAQKYWTKRHVTLADRTSASPDHQKDDFAPVYDDAARDRGDTTPAKVYDHYFQGPNQFVIGNLRCTRSR